MTRHVGARRHCCRHHTQDHREPDMLKGVLLWAIGIPLPIILLLYACGVM
jgi:hypothetical protein